MHLLFTFLKFQFHKHIGEWTKLLYKKITLFSWFLLLFCSSVFLSFSHFLCFDSINLKKIVLFLPMNTLTHCQKFVLLLNFNFIFRADFQLSNDARTRTYSRKIVSSRFEEKKIAFRRTIYKSILFGHWTILYTIGLIDNNIERIVFLLLLQLLLPLLIN